MFWSFCIIDTPWPRKCCDRRTQNLSLVWRKICKLRLIHLWLKADKHFNGNTWTSFSNETLTWHFFANSKRKRCLNKSQNRLSDWNWTVHPFLTSIVEDFSKEGIYVAIPPICGNKLFNKIFQLKAMMILTHDCNGDNYLSPILGQYQFKWWLILE